MTIKTDYFVDISILDLSHLSFESKYFRKSDLGWESVTDVTECQNHQTDDLKTIANTVKLNFT